VRKIGGVLLDKFLLLFRHVFHGMNRVGGAGGNASATVDASLGIHIDLSGGFEPGLVLLGMNAIGGANLNAEGILDAGISNYIRHD